MWKMMSVFGIVLGALSLFAGEGGLKRLFVDLEGWSADEAEVTRVDAGGTTVITATREYEKGGAELDVSITAGSGAMAQMATMGTTGMGDVSVSTQEGAVKVLEIDGFQVTIGHDNEDNSGSVVVNLKPQNHQAGVFAISYEDLSMDEALELAQQFDWTAMKKALACM